MRQLVLVAALVLAGCGGVTSGQEADPYAIAENPAFDAWVLGFRPRALAEGIPAATFDAAFADAGYIPKVIERDRNQSEFTKPLGEYLAVAVSDERVADGRRALAEHGPLLDRIEAAYGVDKEVVAAVWGIESSYGRIRGSVPVVSGLATLAMEGRRGAFFEAQLIEALRILARGDVSPDRMVGSWAGAMGHTQFIPTSFAAYAVDFTGDGRRDIWADDPADALASTAAYLANFGWRQGQPWGVEVVLPDGFDPNLARDTNRQAVSYWNGLGIRGVDGQPVPDHGGAVLLLPSGVAGPAFLTFRNFNVIERYNSADAYVIAVGHLSDRLRGAGSIRARFPHEASLSFAQRTAMQAALTAQGFDTLGIDGLLGPRTIGAIRAFQRDRGLVPDGYPSPEFFRHLYGGGDR